MRSRDLCKHFSITMQTLYLWIKAGLPHTRTAFGQYRFSIDEVEQWIIEKNKKVSK